MNINLTLVGQTVMFALFVWFCMKFIWPPIVNAMEKRKQDIAEGLANAEKGNKFLNDAEEKVVLELSIAREKVRGILSNADKSSMQKIDASKGKAKIEAKKIIINANKEIEAQINRAKEDLRVQVSILAVEGAQKILEKEIDAKTHQEMLSKLSLKL